MKILLDEENGERLADFDSPDTLPPPGRAADGAPTDRPAEGVGTPGTSPSP